MCENIWVSPYRLFHKWVTIGTPYHIDSSDNVNITNSHSGFFGYHLVEWFPVLFDRIVEMASYTMKRNDKDIY